MMPEHSVVEENINIIDNNNLDIAVDVVVRSMKACNTSSDGSQPPSAALESVTCSCEECNEQRPGPVRQEVHCGCTVDRESDVIVVYEAEHETERCVPAVCLSATRDILYIACCFVYLFSMFPAPVWG